MSILLLLLLAANPSFAKGSRAPHGAHAGTTSTVTGGKGTRPANPPPDKAKSPIDARETVAPPAFPSHGVTQHQIRIINPSAKPPVNGPHSQAAIMTNPAPAVRNAIGQPVAMPTNVVGGQHRAFSVQSGSAIAARTFVPATTDRPNVAIAANRGSVNGAAVIRPVVAPAGIGGPAPPRYGINGTTVQTRH